MTWETILRFAPAYDTRHLVGNPEDVPELIVSPNALKTMKLHEPVPVVVDHDFGQVVGRVDLSWVGEDEDYGTRIRRWWFASCELDEKPDWLKRGGGVSWSWNPLSSYRAGDTEILTSCVFREVSLLSPARNPAEPLARVCLVKPSVKRHPQAEPEGQVFGHGQILRRPNIGQVLAVR